MKKYNISLKDNRKISSFEMLKVVKIKILKQFEIND